jgi:RNA polymerase sigma-70 factor (ECF subfamily)
VVVERESLQLALIASLQHLPARQCAILILREVLAFSTAETAEVLDTTTAAVKSGLQRARARLDELEPEPEELLEPTDQRARALLDAYIAAFERSDAGLLEQVLRTDATLEATPFRDWQAGRAMCIHILDTYVLGTPGDWRMIATTANGQPAAVVYHRDADGALLAEGAVVLAPTATGVSRVIKFHNPALVATFGFPDVLTQTRQRVQPEQSLARQLDAMAATGCDQVSGCEPNLLTPSRPSAVNSPPSTYLVPPYSATSALAAPAPSELWDA